MGFLTFHAYRSWSEDNPKGYVQRGKAGVQPPNSRLAKHRAAIALQPSVRFGTAQKRVLIASTRRICEDIGARVHGVSVTPTHVHVLVSWRDARGPRALSTPLKQKLGRDLSHHKGTKGNRWFSRGCDEELVTDHKHFDYLLAQYLPKHLSENGIVWRESDG